MLDELDDVPRVSAEDAIRAARESGLEPATSWVRFGRAPYSNVGGLQAFWATVEEPAAGRRVARNRIRKFDP
jgi:hypothetical protein